MNYSQNTNIERIIAKIDNDFNTSNSDWIPRVGAWVIDAMSQIDVLQIEYKTRKLEVKNNIAYSLEDLPNEIKVYDKNGCEIKELNKSNNCRCDVSIPSTGDLKQTEISNTMSHYVNPSADEHIVSVGKDISNNNIPKHEVIDIHISNNEYRNYVRIGKRKLELNFNADCIIVKYKGIKTEMSDNYCCELPVIPNNGILIEAIVNYCMYKMLCRGYKHPVFNLNASQYGTNPYYMWMQMKDQAKRSVINDGFNEDIDKIWRSAFFISTFDPRR